MTQTYSISGMTCTGCAATVTRALSAIDNVGEVKVNLPLATADVSMSIPVPIEKLQAALKPFPAYQLCANGHHVATVQGSGFWTDLAVWGRAAQNTLSCLIGCSLGDFAMIIFLQRYYPSTSMVMQMVLATLAGLITSVLFETALLRAREKFDWSLAFQTAISMSFLSMVAMELVMNATDFMMTGGKAAFNNPLYWTALVVAMVAGFLAPLPYNYYRLKKYSKACH